MAERTEPATPRRRREARQRGEVARSDDLTSGVVVLAGAALLAWQGPAAFARLAAFTIRTLSTAPTGSLGPALALRAGLEEAIAIIVPPLACLGALGAVVTLLQVGPSFTLQPLAPRLDRLDPMAGARRLFSGRSLFGLAKSLVKLTVVAAVLGALLVARLPFVVRLLGAAPGRLGPALGDTLTRLCLSGGTCLIALGLVDLAYQRFRFARDLRMTKEEVRRESRESEGDPRHKAERTRLHREILAHARIEDVRRADCVIVNPDHIAVALRYDEEEMDAPRVLAKGERALAHRIIDVARAHGIPVVRDVPLARALLALDIDEAIPEELYEAVAAVLRFAYEEHGREPSAGD